MTEAPASSRIQPFTIEQLVRYAETGQLRVPEFQRGFRWGTKDVIELFDSIRRGYPVGNALLWKRKAPRARIRLGDLKVNAPSVPDALWVVDGQQRITSLVNAVNPAVAATSVFAIAYLPSQDRFIRMKEVRGEIAIPLPDLFNIPRLLQWLQRNPDAIEHAEVLQAVTTILRDFSLPTSVVEGANESELRRIFDRINNAGKRLTAAEVFDAINRTTRDTGTPASVSTISDSIAATTTFGKLAPSLVYQALLVRRHPDISRSPHPEFEPDRRATSDFPNEDQTQSYSATEDALRATVDFLQQEVGVPHSAFLPQQFLLLTLHRFFAFFPNPTPRTRLLLSRWFWRAASRASRLGFTGATNTVRGLAGLIRLGDEQGSVRRILEAVVVPNDTPDIDLSTFRTNQAASKIVLCAMWANKPRSLRTGEPMTLQELSASIGDADTPVAVVSDLIRRKDLSNNARLSVGNRLIVDPDDLDFTEWIARGALSHGEETLHSHYLTPSDFLSLEFDGNALVMERERRILRSVATFIQVHSGSDLDDTPSLESLDLDTEFGSERDSS